MVVTDAEVCRESEGLGSARGKEEPTEEPGKWHRMIETPMAPQRYEGFEGEDLNVDNTDGWMS